MQRILCRMLFRGIPNSNRPRCAYIFVILSFIAVPLHFVVGSSSFLQGGAVWLSAAAGLLALSVTCFCKPRDIRLGFYGVLGFLLHATVTWSS